MHAHAHADQQTGAYPRSHRTRTWRIVGASSQRPSFHSARPFDRPSSPPPSSTAHIGFIFSALTIPLPRFPPRSRPPDARAHPPRPMSAFSARVNIAPSESPARECPDGPSPSARPDPPPSKRYITPPSPESLVCWRGECVIDDPRVRLHRDSTFFFLFDRRARSAAQHATAPSKAQFDPPLARSIDRLEDEPTPIADAPNHRAPRTTPSPRTLRFSRNEPIKSAPRPFY